MQSNTESRMSLKKNKGYAHKGDQRLPSNLKAESIELHQKNMSQARKAKRGYFFAVLIVGGFQLFSAINTMFKMFDKGQNFLVIGVVVFAFSLGLVLSMNFLIKEHLKAAKRERDALKRIKECEGLLL